MYNEDEEHLACPILGSSNGLVNSYRAANVEAGHSYNCSYGAGADCTCGSQNVTLFVVTAVLGGRTFVVRYSDSLEFAREYARDARASFPGVRLRRLVLDPMGTEWLSERARIDMERIDDWSTDGR